MMVCLLCEGEYPRLPGVSGQDVKDGGVGCGVEDRLHHVDHPVAGLNVGRVHGDAVDSEQAVLRTKQC